MRSTRRSAMWSVIAIATVAAVAFPGGAAVASGGGGCGRPVSDARGDTVRIRNFCFGPTILRVHPGDEVRFVNADGTPHTVMGANASWGSFRQLNTGKEITYRFTRSGVYPYVCTYHLGMVGAVVVGGGPRMATGATTTASGPMLRDANRLAAVKTTTGMASRQVRRARKRRTRARARKVRAR